MHVVEIDLQVLVAEDDPDDALLLQRAMRRAGLGRPVHICRTGDEVIEYLSGKGDYHDRERFPFPRVLILDLKMPRMNGLEVLGWIQRHAECVVIPTVIFSASKHPKDVTEAYRLGANAYFEKPAKFEDMVRLLRLNHQFWSACELSDVAMGGCN